MTVSVQYAFEHFEELASAAEDGEEIVIDRPEQPAMRLVPVVRVRSRKRTSLRTLGAGKAILSLPSPEELERIDREWKLMIDEKVLGEPRPSSR